jgi:hypothetical protein
VGGRDLLDAAADGRRRAAYRSVLSFFIAITAHIGLAGELLSEGRARVGACRQRVLLGTLMPSGLVFIAVTRRRSSIA